METFDLYGYQRVTTPPVEYAEVIERGLGTVDRRDLVRFIEPDSGEVALLRPDVPPQIARIVATRLQDRPAPWRLCYEGTIVRRRRGRARKQRQVLQCGIECIGLMKRFIGQGLGGYLLTRATTRAWDMGAERVWLTTCSHDHPHALQNYLDRGYRIKNQTEGPANPKRRSVLPEADHAAD